MKNISGNLQLGEGCVWDEEAKIIYYVDIEGYTIYGYSIEKGESFELYIGDYVGTIVLDNQGNIIAAVRNKLIYIDVATRESQEIFRLFDSDLLRCNDGKCDKYGNLWLGTMAIDQAGSKAKNAGSLYCIKQGEVIAQYNDFTIPNGLAWNARGDQFYHIDTVTQCIFVYDVLDEGIITNKKILISVDKNDGSPDGMCIDESGNLWVAMWGGGKVICYSGSDGNKLSEILMPSTNVTCCTFGGDHMDILFITSARDDDGNLGGLYSVKLDHIRGCQAYRYNNG